MVSISNDSLMVSRKGEGRTGCIGILVLLVFVLILLLPGIAFGHVRVETKIQPEFSGDYHESAAGSSLQLAPAISLHEFVLVATGKPFTVGLYDSEFPCREISACRYSALGMYSQTYRKVDLEQPVCWDGLKHIANQTSISECRVRTASLTPKLPIHFVSIKSFSNVSGLWIVLSVTFVSGAAISGVMILARWQIKRRAKRYTCSISATCSLGQGNKQSVRIEEISMIGCLMRVLHDDIEQGTVITLDIHGIEVKGRVVWRNESLSGVEFASPLRLHVVCRLAADYPK